MIATMHTSVRPNIAPTEEPAYVCEKESLTTNGAGECVKFTQLTVGTEKQNPEKQNEHEP